MTLATTTASVTYNGNGVTTSFAYGFKIWDADDLELWITDAAGAKVQVTSDYNITGIESPTGGTVTYPVAADPLASGNKLTLLRRQPLVQDFFDPSNNSVFLAETLEDAIDRTIALDQQLEDDINRGLRSAISSDIDPELPAPEAGKVLGWNDTEDGIVNLTPTGAVLGTDDVNTVNLTDACVTTPKIATDAVDKDKINADIAGDALTQNVSGALDVVADDTTIETNASALRVKDAGITQAKLSGIARGSLVSANDTAMGYLNGKLLAGYGMSLTEGNDAADETLTIARLPQGFTKYVADDTYEVPAGISYLYAIIVGGGGGGGGGGADNQDRSSGGGGGGGGVIEGWIDVTAAETLTLTVGAGGVGGVGGGAHGAPGVVGEVSEIVSSEAITLLLAPGGAPGGGGRTDGSSGGAGGAGGGASTAREIMLLKTTSGTAGVYAATAVQRNGGTGGAAAPVRGVAGGGGTVDDGGDGTGAGAGGGGGASTAPGVTGDGGSGSAGAIFLRILN